jgi:hypothetical protein
MSANVVDFETQSELKQRAARIGAKMAAIRAGLKRAREDWFDVADDILGARMELPSDQDFGRWWNAQEWAEDIGPHNRAACIVLALNRERCLRLAAHSGRSSPETMLEFVNAIIKDEGTEPLRQWRDPVCEPSQTSHQGDDPPAAPQNPAPEAPEPAQPPETELRKKHPG